MIQSPERTKTTSNPVDNTHSPKAFLRGNQSYFICDHCGKEVKEEDATKMSKGKNKDYVYCPECTKILYPKYKKVTFSDLNPVMKNIMNEALARKEYRR